MTMRLKVLRFCAVAAAVFVAGIAAAQQVTVMRDAPLLSEPKAGASTVGQLSKGGTAEVVEQRGAWVNVKSGSATGWTYSFNVAFSAGGGSGAAAAGPSQKRATVSTLGVRGLEKEDLKNATFDGGQLDALDSFAAGAEGDKPAPKGASKKK